jgi:RNA polymerase sigma factor (sigma-70 family)
MFHPIEEKIIRLIKKKDKEFVSLIYDHYADSLYGIIKRMVGEEALAQDILQESFLKIWKKADQYDPEKARLFTWLLSVTRHTAIDKLRSVKTRASREIQMEDSNVYDLHTSNIKPQHMDIKDLLAGLDQKYKEVIEALFFQGLTQREASNALNIPLGTIKTRLKIGLRELREIFVDDVLFILIAMTIL